ncbi:hypothetical protein UP10_25300 [Bradyrhizobium sp. LTSPM299]|nr:hypothetical protein UP10_25300 [Bradyrhizobium sp. LTSPM299]
MNSSIVIETLWWGVVRQMAWFRSARRTGQPAPVAAVTPRFGMAGRAGAALADLAFRRSGLGAVRHLISAPNLVTA